MDMQKEFREWFSSKINEYCPSYGEWWKRDDQLENIRKAYNKSFGTDVFEVDENNVKKNINNIIVNLGQRKGEHINSAFRNFDKGSLNGAPHAILNTWFIPFLEERFLQIPFNREEKSQKSNPIRIQKSTPNQPQEKEKPKTILIKKPSSDTPHEIIQRIKDKIIQINKNCKYYKKDPIFNEVGTLEIWRNIEKICFSEESFIIFSIELYKLLYETTRSKNPHFDKNKDRGKDYYLYRLPNEFVKNGKPTKHFMDIIGALRHFYAHKEPEYNVHINTLTFPDILEELNVKRLPVVDFEKLQIEILKLFDNSMEELQKILENEFNRLINH